MGRYSPLLASDYRFTPELAISYRTGQEETTQLLGVLGSVLNRRNAISIRNGILLYKQPIRPTVDYVCPIWRCAARSYINQLQALLSKCLRTAADGQ
jgi:hypothetical protein